MLRVTVVGTGHLGATHAAGMAELGHEVLGMDSNAETIQALARGKAPFFEPGLDETLTRHTKSGRLRFTTSYEEVASFGDVHFICVGTPQADHSYAADLRQLHSACEALAPLLSPDALVVGRSTVPVGTAKDLAHQLSVAAQGGLTPEVAWNPEFLREGSALEDTLHPSRLVFGVSSPRAAVRLEKVYERLVDEGVPVCVTDLATAELVKVTANAYLATRISFINGVADLCDAAGANIQQLALALSHDARIGGTYMTAGLGFGGGCLPKDLRAFVSTAEDLGVADLAALLHAVEDINAYRRVRLCQLTREALGGTSRGSSIAVLGAAFKPMSDDVRESPALEVAARLLEEGASVAVYDPRVRGHARMQHPGLAFKASVEEAVEGADAVLVLTAWKEFATIDPRSMGKLVRRRIVIDGRQLLDDRTWKEAGWLYVAPGRLHLQGADYWAPSK